MKRLLVLLILFWSCRIYAQDEPKVFEGGLVAGANFTQVDGDSYFGYHKIGINAGGIVCVHFSKYIGASLELLYSQKGSRAMTTYDSPTIGTYMEEYSMTLNYVEVPLLLQIFAGDRYRVELGASYARLVKASEWVFSDVPVIIDPVANRFNTSDLNYVFGVQRRIWKSLFVNARFQYSITSIRPPDRIPYGYSYGNQGQFNNVVNLRLMYYL